MYHVICFSVMHINNAWANMIVHTLIRDERKKTSILISSKGINVYNIVV